MKMELLGQFLKAKSPFLLTLGGSVGVIATAVLTGKAVIKANEIIKDYEKEYEFHHNEAPELTFKDKLQLTWKCFIPATTVGLCTIASINGAQVINNNRQMALAGMAAATDKAYKVYKSRIQKHLGEKVGKELNHSMLKEEVDSTAEQTQINDIPETGYGMSLCYDRISGRFFWSDIEEIRRAVNRCCRYALGENFVKLNQIYGEMNLAHTDCGETYEYHIADGTIDVEFDSMITFDGRPCVTVQFLPDPRLVLDY